MICPFCFKEDTNVVDSRPAEGGNAVRRRRSCSSCGKRFTTYERYEEIPLIVVKKDGRRERFDRRKIIDGLMTACQKRSVPYKDIENLAASAERDLRASGETEIKAEEIGRYLMEKLRDLDDVPFVRFASVYEEFNDVSRFTELLQFMEQAKVRLSAEETK